MAVHPTGFVFDDKTTEEFGLILCSFDSGYEDGVAGSEIEFTKTSNPVRKRWYKTGNATYQSPLEFSVQVAKPSFEEFDTYELAAIQRWLIRQDGYKDFQFIQKDYDNVHFNVMVNKMEYVGTGIVRGITINFVCDSPFGYGHLEKFKYSASGNTLVFKIIDMSDEIGYIYPDVTIEILQNCNLSIHNSIENRTFTVKNCIKNEVITIDGKTLQMSTTAISHNLYNDSNYIFPRIANKYYERTNIFTINGKCNITMSYRPIRKVGV